MNGSEIAGRMQADTDATYICIRVVDALLREDVRGCVSDARVLQSARLAECAGFLPTQQWLEIGHLGLARLWIAVEPIDFMQPWRLARLPLLMEAGQALRELHGVAEILEAFSANADKDTGARFKEFVAECLTAVEHRRAAEAARREWFDDDAAGEPAHWHERMLRYDRLASFLDHPLYPTARAKLGFAIQDLRHYAPEHGCAFELHWLAVPLELRHACGGRVPPEWPGFSDVGLPEALIDSHALVPVHPFVWNGELDAMLHRSGLASKVVRAPKAHLLVRPTLSVRTLALTERPGCHLKLPLTIRTLGAKNIRTIKPSTIADGQCVQELLESVKAREPAFRERLLLTDESTGADVDQREFLGYIVRSYPEAALNGATPVPVAGLLAPLPTGNCVAEELAHRFYDGDTSAFFADYLELTLRLHLTLWIRYGIALESNQQNSIVVLSERTPRLRLLLKDNDAARLYRARLEQRAPDVCRYVNALQDARMVVADELPLAQMFVTITLQLNLAVLVEGLAGCVEGFSRASAYELLRSRTRAVLDELAAEGEDVALAQKSLLEDEKLHIKRLLTAATLMDKDRIGAADVNKFYGKSAPNFLRAPS